MKAHVAQRLSQYLDGEIAAYERDVIVAHLRECAECARRLEELTAVDDMARSLTVEVPQGYFDAFPSRVRAQLRAPAKHHPAPPVWSFAAAAALLLGVLTPILWHHASTPELADRGAAPAASLSRTGTPAPPPASVVAEEPLRLSADEAKAVLKDTRTPPALEKRAASEDEPLAGAPKKKAQIEQQAAAPPAKEEPTARRRDAAPAASATGFAGAPGASRDADALQPQSTESAARAEPPAASDRSAYRAQGGAAGRVTANAAPAAGAPELRYGALLAQKLANATQARSLREAWGAYVESDPAGPHADEARVSKIEAGMLAYRLSGEATDREVVERDAAEYLARPDARQASRVRALLASIEPR